MAVVAVTDNTFKSEVLEAKGKVLVDVWAPWCGPCRALSPIVEEVSNENPGFKVCKVNADENPEVCNALGVTSIPALFVFENGELYNQTVGLCSKDAIYNLVK